VHLLRCRGMAFRRILLRLGLLGSLASCTGQQEAAHTNEVSTEIPASTPAEPAAPTLVEQPLSRKAILLAVTEAASSHALGRDDAEQQQPLDGRPFTFRIRLCGPPDDDFQSAFDEESKVLRVSVRPSLTVATLQERGIAAAGWQSVEGFWVPRPWLLEAACPGAGIPDAPGTEQEGARPPGPSPSTIGIAQFDADGRAQSIMRGHRSYQITRQLGNGSVPEAIDLVLQGRLQRLPRRRVITCTGDAISQPPTCVVSARFDQVRLEQATGELLAEWSEG